YRAAHYVVFVNYEEFLDDIERTQEQHEQPGWYFSGYDCDSLAMEPVTGFINYALDRFSQLERSHLEIRTKSTQISSLLHRAPLDNAVIAFSFTPQQTATQHEYKVPSVQKRIAAAVKLQQAGWKIGIRLDPMITSTTFQDDYRELLNQLFDQLDRHTIHSVSYGAFRLPRDFFKRMVKLYPREALFAGNLTENSQMVSYPPSVEAEQGTFIHRELTKYLGEERIYPCDI
ncbi:MAG: spore photoproduct lyase family protein, partial [Pseudomonadota bacterium]